MNNDMFKDTLPRIQQGRPQSWVMKYPTTIFPTFILQPVTHSSPRCLEPPQPRASGWRAGVPETSGLIAAGN